MGGLPGMGQGPTNEIPFGAGQQGAPQADFRTRHPRLTGFLENLGPALGALNIEPQQPTAYPQSGLTNILQGLGRAGQTFTGARENIQKSRVQRATSKAAEPGLKKLAAGAPLEQMSQNDLYGLSLSGLPQPPALSGSEQRQAALTQGGFQLSAADKAHIDIQEKQIKAENDYRLRLLGIQEKEAGTAAAGIEQRLQESRADFVREIGASNSAQYGAAVALFNSMYLGKELDKKYDAALEGLAAPQLVRAQAAGSAAKVRGQQLIQNITELLNKKPGLSDDQRLEINYALLRLQSLTSDPNIFLYYPGARDEYDKALKTIEKIMPEAKAAIPDSRSWIDKVLGFIGAKGKELGSEALTVTPNKPTGANAGRDEYDALVAEAQKAGGRLPPDKAARLRELATQFGNQ